MEASYWMLIGGVVTLFKTPLAAMFVTGEGADRVIALAVQYLGTMALFYLLPAMTNGFQGYYRGMGNMPMTLLGTLDPDQPACGDDLHFGAADGNVWHCLCLRHRLVRDANGGSSILLLAKSAK